MKYKATYILTFFIIFKIMEVPIQRQKACLFPRFMRDVNSKTYKHIKQNKQYRKYFEKAVRGLYRKKNYHDTSLLFFLKLYCVLAPLDQSNQIFIEITTDALNFAEETRRKCVQQYRELIDSVQNEETVITKENLERQCSKICSMQRFLLYLRETTELDYDTVVDQHLRQMYTIHSLSKHDYFTIPRQRQVRKIIDNYQELYHQKVEEVKNLCNGVTSRRLRLINEKINYNHIGAEASRI